MSASTISSLAPTSAVPLRAPEPPDMIDLVFDLAGDGLPREHRESLWAALLEHLPWLADEPEAGPLPIRAVQSAGEELLLSRRSRLVLRLPRSRLSAAGALEGASIRLEGRVLRVGSARRRDLEPFPTLKAAFVAGNTEDEAAFEREVAAMLEALGLPDQRFICGRMHALGAGSGRLSGAPVVLHDLAPARSLFLQCTGLGPHRHLGCGIMVPHKTISGLD